MAKIVSNQLTFLDMTDQNQLSLYLTSNLQTVQVYDAATNTYNPSWLNTPLEIELQAFLNQEEIKNSDTNLSVQWYVKDGIKDKTPIDGATSKTLIINTNDLGTSESHMLTYICEAIYLNDMKASSQLTYSLIDNGNTGGEDVVIFKIYAPNGTVVSEAEDSVQIETVLYKGVNEITSDITYQWAKYVSGVYEDIAGATKSTYVVRRDDVSNVQTYKCTVTYEGQTYIDVITIEDKYDTYASEMLTIGGTVFKNGQGGCAVYVIVRSNGKEVDAFPDGCSIGTSEPNNPTEGTYWWKVEPGAATFVRYNGSEWEETFSDVQSLDYIWTLMDKDGNVTEFYKTGKVIYLSCSEIDEIGTLQCDVKPKGLVGYSDGMVYLNAKSGYYASDDSNGNIEVSSTKTYTVTDDDNGNVTIN